MPQKRPVIGGIYRHYKSTGGLDHVYRVVGLSRHTETEEYLVIYEALYPNDWVIESQIQFSARPLAMFMDEVEVGGSSKPRFQLISDPTNLD